MAKKNITEPAGVPAIKPKWQHILLLVFITIAIYSNSLSNSFVYDDTAVIVNNSFIRNIKNIPSFFIKPVKVGSVESFRPLAMASFTLNYSIGELNVLGYHVVNVLFHAVNVMLVYMLMLMLLEIVSGKDKNTYLMAFFVSLVFAVHPINSEAVNYTWQRSVLLSTCFYLSAIILFIKYRLAGKIHLYVFAVLCFILALLGKEIAITFPVVIMLIDRYCIPRDSKQGIIKNHIPFIVISIIFLLIVFVGQGAIKEFTYVRKVSPFTYLLTQFWVITKYIRLILLPYGLSADHGLFAYGILNIKVWASLVLIMLIILAGFRLRKSSRLVFLGILWFFICLVPTSSILPLKVIMNEHRLYLPGIGLLMAIILLMHKYSSRMPKGAFLSFLTLMVLVFSVLTMDRNTHWQNNITLWSQALEVYPDNTRALNNRGAAYAREEQFEKAISDFNRALKIQPDNISAFNNRKTALEQIERPETVVLSGGKVMDKDSGDFDVHYALGMAYAGRGKQEEAMASYNRAIKLNPSHPEVYYKRGILYDKKGLKDKALEDFNMAIQLNPEYVDAYIDRGVAQASQGFTDKALKDFTRAIEIDPMNDKGYSNRGIVYGQANRFQEALADFTKAIELKPRNPNKYNDRAILHNIMGNNDLALKDHEKAKALRK